MMMIRHGSHIIFTQMVSTHDVMVRGSLDFPNLINLNNITQDFVVDVEIYGMVSSSECDVIMDDVHVNNAWDVIADGIGLQWQPSLAQWHVH